MARTDCDPKLRAELDRLSLELDIERTMQNASEIMTIRQLLEEAQERGIEYGRGYEEGFFAAVDLSTESNAHFGSIVDAKYTALNKRWNL